MPKTGKRPYSHKSKPRFLLVVSIFTAAAKKTTLQTNYKGRFKYQVGIPCNGPDPVLQAACQGNGEIELVGVSDSSITCNKLESNILRCKATCEDTDCSAIYRTTDYDDETFGEFTFSCKGDHLTDVTAEFVYKGSFVGCAKSPSVWLDNFNYHHGQLGVMCETPNGTNEYEFLSQFFECGDSSDTVDIGGNYGCYAGENCDFDECQVHIPDLSVAVEQPPTADFQERCIEKMTLEGSTALPTLPPTPAPTFSLGNYTVQFEAHWQVYFWHNLIFCSIVSPPTLNLKCVVNGDGENNHEIQILETLNPNIECFKTSETEVNCVDDCVATCDATKCNVCDYFVGDSDSRNEEKFSGVVYECNGSQPMHTLVEFLPGNVSCPYNGKMGAQKLELGIRCNEDEVAFDFSDRFSECGDGAEFDINLVNSNFQCAGWGTIRGSENVDALPLVTMFTNKACFVQQQQSLNSTLSKPIPEDTTSFPTSSQGDNRSSVAGSGAIVRSSVAKSGAFLSVFQAMLVATLVIVLVVF